jgi:UDPglucose 6-dehydrogenase
MNRTVGIIGYGFVGKAVANSFITTNQIILKIHDPAYPELSEPVESLLDCDAIFVCVPTNQLADGSCNTDALKTTLQILAGYSGIVICKSTAPPDVYRNLQNTTGLRLVHAPEFLTAKNATLDYLYPSKIVIGTDSTALANDAAKFILPYVNFSGSIDFCSIEEAAMFKYVANTMLAMKVLINNEYADLCEKLNISWNAVAKIAEADPRLGSTHWNVPGPDGNRGFGGACFPKDTSALAAVAVANQVDMSMLVNAILKNKVYRNDV